MQQLMEFTGNHAMLVSLFVLVSAMLMWNLLGGNLSGIEELGPFQATQLINHEEAVVVDVREDNEFAGGHIINSLHIPMSGLKDKLKRLEKYREHPIILSCRSGSRSLQAASTLKKQGFQRVYNLKGGVLAWQNANLPLTTQKTLASKS